MLANQVNGNSPHAGGIRMQNSEEGDIVMEQMEVVNASNEDSDV